MFSAIDEKEQNIVINAMQIKKFNAGDYVIRQGDDGNHLFVVESGVLDCYVKMTKLQKLGKKVVSYTTSDSFGELALLYNTPRAASIVAKTDCVLFALDRQTFNHIVKDAAARKRQRYEKFLQNVEILQSLDLYDRLKVADGLKGEVYPQGSKIVTEVNHKEK